ncbi:MAG: 50S ribosomal protein L21 [Chloroflexota bacterium]
MKYAIVQSGSRQMRAEVGGTLEVDRLPKAAGDPVELDVLLLADGDKVTIGAPTVAGAKVQTTVVEHFRGEKIRIFKYKAKERQRKRGGHRQDYTRLKVETIVG